MRPEPDLTMAVEWSMTPNSTTAHIFEHYPSSGLSVSLCHHKIRESSLLRQAKDDEHKCQICLMVLNAKR